MKITGVSSLIFGLILLIGQAYAAEVAVIPATRIINPGTTFDMNISIDPQGIAIAGAQLDIAFNGSLIRVNGITEENLFKQSGANTFFSSGIINNSTGTVINVFDAIIGRKNVSTQGIFITINATAIGYSGTSAINLSNVKISDPDGNPVILNVNNGSVRINNPPLLAAIGNKMINEGQIFSIILSATDIDADLLTYSATGLPGGASFNPATRTFQWTPNYTQSGSYWVHFEVSDGFSIDDENIIITVNDINRAPLLALTPANGSIFNETDSIQINVTAKDPDNDALSYIIKIDGIQVSTSSSYKWKTNYKSSGYHTIEASVTDGKAIVVRTSTIYIRNVHSR